MYSISNKESPFFDDIFNQLYFWKGERAALIVYIYFHFVLLFLITTLLFLYSLQTRKKIKKNNSEQLWYCQTNRKHWKMNLLINKLFQNEKNVLYALCWMISYLYNHAITYICNKEVFILYLWPLWWRVFRKFFIFSFSSKKSYVLKYNKQINRLKWNDFFF